MLALNGIVSCISRIFMIGGATSSYKNKNCLSVYHSKYGATTRDSLTKTRTCFSTNKIYQDNNDSAICPKYKSNN